MFTAMGSEERNTEAGTRAQEGEEEEGEELCLYHWEPQSFWNWPSVVWPTSSRLDVLLVIAPCVVFCSSLLQCALDLNLKNRLFFFCCV